MAGSDNTNKFALMQKRDIPGPAQLVEEFKKIYNTEYKTAYHDLEKHYKLKEENITELLAGMAKVSFRKILNIILFCSSSSKCMLNKVILFIPSMLCLCSM